MLAIGCGSGQNLERLAGQGLEVAGVEPDSAACDAARALVAQAGLAVERVKWWGYARQFHPDWIATEAQAEAVFAGQVTADAARLARHRRRAWGLLARTLLAPAARRHDSVRLILRAGQGRQRRKLAISRKPVAWDFSGWNWVPTMVSRPTMAVTGPA